MKIDIDQVVDRSVLPWDLTVKLMGKEYPTRPLVIGDQAALAAAQAAEDGEALRSAVLALLNNPAELAAIPVRYLVPVVFAVQAYAESVVLKNLKAVAENVRAAMANPPAADLKASIPGSSSSSSPDTTPQ